MIHHLITSEDRTLITCSATQQELDSSVSVLNYSLMLLNLSEANRGYARSFAREISELDQIRETWFELEKESGNWESIDQFIESKFEKIATNWGLKYHQISLKRID